jgi:hypothetical protein
MSELKPCPFCGLVVVLLVFAEIWLFWWVFW